MALQHPAGPLPVPHASRGEHCHADCRDLPALEAVGYPPWARAGASDHGVAGGRVDPEPPAGTTPGGVEEAAALAGCGTLQTLVRMVLPLALPGLVVAGLLAWLFSWE